ncbi:MAG: hypothetical protein IJJ00_02695 [Erysipelotrichaceae bacterium]|nr:hypothetical protein [Erysipelotrichaceae bacterium]
MKELSIDRIHLSYGNEEYDYLDSLCDYEISLERPFAKLFNEHGDFTKFLVEELCPNLHLPEEYVNELLARYDSGFFLEYSLVMMFSDERSGANRLTLESVEVSEDKDVFISIIRDRGLSMDMAYLFMFIDLDKDSYGKVFPHIINSNKEASFF